MVPDGERWAAAYTDVPERERHLALHDRHLIAVNDRDRSFVTGALLAANGLALSRAGWRERLALFEEQGATEIAYQPAGPDIVRENESGWVLPIRSAGAFIARLRWCDANREALARMVERIYSDFQPRGWDGTAAAFETICDTAGALTH